jgi:anaerobic magnesium-protoporphyrin IX monomethyl ester cyclase
MAKIALINPPSPFLLDERVFPNLGLVQLATSWTRKNHSVELIDLCGIKTPEERLKDVANRFDIIGFSSTTPQFRETYRLHGKVREFNPSAKTIIGGAHPSAVYSLIKSGNNSDINIRPLEEFDYIVVGEGDHIDAESLTDKWTISPLTRDLDMEPTADRSLIDLKSYRYLLGGQPTTTIMTQRGCPFKCTFCCGREIDMYRKPRHKSSKKVLEELDYLNGEFGFSSFMWFDDEININSNHLKEVSELLKDRNYQHRGFVRSDLLIKHPETLDYLAEAGFVELCSGVESGSERILGLVRKGTTPEINSMAAQMIKKAGFSYKAFTIIGHPSETSEDVQETEKWLEENQPDGFDISIMVPYPGSVIYDHSTPSTKHEGYLREWKGLYFNQIDYSSADSFYKGKPGEYTCHVRTDELSAKDLIGIREKIEAKLKSP